MFRQQPSLAADLLTEALRINIPLYQQAHLEAVDFTDLVPTEYRADAVVKLTAAEAPVLAIAHGRDDGYDKVLDALAPALTDAGSDRGRIYYDIAIAALPDVVRRHLEELMATTYQYKSDVARGYFADGQVKGEATALLYVLEARGVHLADDARTRITECSDLSQLDTWLRRVATVASAEELFA